MKFSYSPLRNLVIFIVIISAIFYFLGKRKSTSAKIKEEEFVLFNNADIKGRLVDIGFTLNVSFFKVDNNTHRFIFDPNISAEGSLFNANTEEGDSIIKPKFSKQLLVKGKERTDVYTFRNE